MFYVSFLQCFLTLPFIKKLANGFGNTLRVNSSAGDYSTCLNRRNMKMQQSEGSEEEAPRDSKLLPTEAIWQNTHTDTLNPIHCLIHQNSVTLVIPSRPSPFILNLVHLQFLRLTLSSPKGLHPPRFQPVFS